MNHPFLLRTLCATLVAGLLTLSPAAWSGPGAHGPNGEHLDGPATPVTAQARPRIEARSELFELVGTLSGGELSLLIDRYASNEPLLKAEVEVESGGLKAKASFHADIGAFAVDDLAMLKKLSSPGEHALVITVLAGDESDLLDGVLRVAEPSGEAAHGPARPWGRWLLGAGLGAAALGLVRWRRRQVASRAQTNPGGGQA